MIRWRGTWISIGRFESDAVEDFNRDQLLEESLYAVQLVEHDCLVSRLAECGMNVSYHHQQFCAFDYVHRVLQKGSGGLALKASH